MKGSNRRKVVAGAAAVAAVVGTGAAVGATQWSPEAESDEVLADAAKQLGVEPNELEGAITQALENRLDEAVAAGRLTQEQADALKERLESGEIPLFGGGGPGGHHGPGMIGSFDAAAEYLGLTDEELRTKLQEDGTTLADVAKAQDKSVDGLVAALVTAAKQDVADAVDAGRMTEAQQTEILAGLEERITDLVNSEGRRGGPPGGGFPGGPPPADDGSGSGGTSGTATANEAAA